jgi:hypothetical protein
VRTEDVDLGMLGGEPAESALVGDPLPPVRRHGRLEQPDPGRADAPGPVHLAGVEEGVPGVEQPAARGLDGDAAVAAGVPEQGELMPA